ncbi:FadR family transcriptional regulator, partial [Bacteroides ovatus]
MTSKILNSLPHLANDSVTKQVTDILSDLIVTGKIVEGDFLPTEEDLCHEFGIGRSSVREAIKTLESRGMVRKLHGKGVEVIDESA